MARSCRQTELRSAGSIPAGRRVQISSSQPVDQLWPAINGSTRELPVPAPSPSPATVPSIPTSLLSCALVRNPPPRPQALFVEWSGRGRLGTWGAEGRGRGRTGHGGQRRWGAGGIVKRDGLGGERAAAGAEAVAGWEEDNDCGAAGLGDVGGGAESRALDGQLWRLRRAAGRRGNFAFRAVEARCRDAYLVGTTRKLGGLSSRLGGSRNLKRGGVGLGWGVCVCGGRFGRGGSVERHPGPRFARGTSAEGRTRSAAGRITASDGILCHRWTTRTAYT
jgi:hypothetical protein